MAADALTHPPLFTDDQAHEIRGTLMAMSLPMAEFELDTAFVAWDTSCWQCGERSRVWMENPTFGSPAISRDCTRATVRREVARTGAPPAVLRTVTTKAGGTYLGFTCPWCHAVHGRHFLRVELYRRILNDRAGIRSVLLEGDPEADPQTEDDLVPLDETLTPAERAAAHIEWEHQMRALTEFLRLRSGRYPTGRKREAIWLRQQRAAAAQGALPVQRRVQLDQHAPKWVTWNQ